jgi:hypothetical protein
MRNDNVKLNKNNYGNEAKKEDDVLTVQLAILIRKIIGTKLELTMTITIIMMIPDVDHNNFDNHHECKESNDAGS